MGSDPCGGTLGTMSDADVAEILKLPPEQRMRLVEIIWASLAAEPSSVPLGDAHRAVIDERVAEHERNPDDVISREQVLKEARRS
jgi:putative addiction module component (TIGR02574 family)